LFVRIVLLLYTHVFLCLNLYYLIVNALGYYESTFVFSIIVFI